MTQQLHSFFCLLSSGRGKKWHVV